MNINVHKTHCTSLDLWQIILFSFPRNKKTNDEDVLNDIDNMLQGLTEELDAMLEEELILDEWFCRASLNKVVRNEQNIIRSINYLNSY